MHRLASTVLREGPRQGRTPTQAKAAVEGRPWAGAGRQTVSPDVAGEADLPLPMREASVGSSEGEGRFSRAGGPAMTIGTVQGKGTLCREMPPDELMVAGLIAK